MRINMSYGVLILGHGTKRPEGVKSMLAVGKTIKQRLKNVPVETAFMAYAEPGIMKAVGLLVEKGITNIVVVPCFLFEGIHVLEDIPHILTQLEKHYQQKIRFVCTPSVGGDSRLIDILLDRIREAS
jgi:sirohydrochlorin ferrochelatase